MFLATFAFRYRKIKEVGIPNRNSTSHDYAAFVALFVLSVVRYYQIGTGDDEEEAQAWHMGYDLWPLMYFEFILTYGVAGFCTYMHSKRHMEQPWYLFKLFMYLSAFFSIINLFFKTGPSSFLACDYVVASIWVLLNFFCIVKNKLEQINMPEKSVVDSTPLIRNASANKKTTLSLLTSGYEEEQIVETEIRISV